MAKYYVQSGSVSYVVTAADAEGAALWILNRIIDAKAPVDELEPQRWAERMTDSERIGFFKLEQVFHISEIGWGRDEVAIFATEDLFRNWFDLMSAMQNLFDRLG